MTQPNRHRIQRQVIELSLGSDVSGAPLHESSARSCWQRVLPELTEVFDSVASVDELVQFDRLEIDLGTLTSNHWEPQFCKRLVSELTRRLSSHTGAGLAPAPAKPFVQPDARPLEQFVYFLLHGRLPWWSPRPEQGWTALLQERRDLFSGTTLRGVVTSDARARVRLIDALDDRLLDAAIADWAGLPNAARALAELMSPTLHEVVQRSWRRHGWRAIFDCVLADGFAAERGQELMRDLLELRAAYLAPGGVSTVIDSDRMRAEPKASADQCEEFTLPAPWRDWIVAPNTAPETKQVTASPGLERAQVSAPGKVMRFKPSNAERLTAPLVEESIYLPCAGAVLLHPFLEPLFRDRGLLEGRRFCGAAARQRAVHLTGYLGWGITDLPEYDLVIAKLLCGHSLEEPIEPASPDADDVAACDQLLAAVLGHWNVLCSSSPQWLRDQFFLRDGKLESVDDGHRLTVERRAQDVLLARIPWGFGVIALPWMRDRLFVSWLD